MWSERYWSNSFLWKKKSSRAYILCEEFFLFLFLLITRFLLFFSLTSPLDCHLKNYFYQISCSNYCNNPTGCGLNDDAIAIVAISHSISLKFLHLVALLAKNMIFVDNFQLCDFSSFFAYLLRQLHYQFVFMRS